MIVKNRYYYRSRIKEAKFRQLIRCFALDYTATSAAQLIHISTRSVNTIYLKVRERIAQSCDLEFPLQKGVDTDAPRSIVQRDQTKHDRLTANTAIVFGILKYHGKIFTEIVPNYSKATLQAIIRGLIAPDAAIHLDGWRNYDGLVDVGFGKHFLLHPGNDELASDDRHANDIESFWRFAKRRLTKFNGVPEHTFYLHLKETEFRFNHRHDNLYLEILKLLRLNPL